MMTDPFKEMVTVLDKLIAESKATQVALEALRDRHRQETKVEPGSRNLSRQDVEWVFSSCGDLGVKIGNRFFFLYKENSIEYTVVQPDQPVLWRKVGKDEAKDISERAVAANEEHNLGDGSGWQALPIHSTE